MITKVYELTRKQSAYFETKYCGVFVPMSFTTGRGSGGEIHAELIVSDRFTQDAIEHDPRFGREYYLARQFGEDEISETEKQIQAEKASTTKKNAKKKETAKEEPKAEQVESVSTLNDAYDYFAEKGIVVENEEQLKDAMKNANVEFPNLK